MHPSTRFFLTGLCLVMLAGCGISKPSRFYILTPVEDTPAAAQITPGPVVGIGPVTFPDYLDRPEIAHRSGDNQLHYATSDRWAEPLKTTFRRTLAQNVSTLLPTDRIAMHPWPRATVPDYQVVLDITRFDADADGTVVLVVNWEIIRPEDKSLVKRHKSSYSESAGSMAYPAIVAAQSHTVERLGREIALAIKSAVMHGGK